LAAVAVVLAQTADNISGLKEKTCVTPRSVEQDIHALEEQRDQALLLADSDTLTHLLGDGLVYTYWSGRSDGKTDYLEGVKSGRFLYRKIERPDERIQVYDGLAWLRDARTSRWS